MLFEDDTFDYSDFSTELPGAVLFDPSTLVFEIAKKVVINVSTKKLEEWIKKCLSGRNEDSKESDNTTTIDISNEAKELSEDDIEALIGNGTLEDKSYCCIHCHTPIKTDYDFCPNCQKMTIHGLQHKAEQGDIDAIKELSYFVINGIGVAQDVQNGIGLCFEAAKLGDAEAQYDMGQFYETGTIFSSSPLLEAFNWYQKSAEQDYDAAQVKIGLCYKNGIGIEQNDNLAFEWWEKAAKAGNKVAQRNMGYCYGKGIGVQQNAEKALYWFEKAAEQGDLEAQYYLGIFYCNGIGCQKNYTKGIKWLLSAGEMNYGRALQALKRLLDSSQSFEVLSEIFGKVGNNDAESQYILGMLYQQGLFLPQDITKAVELFEKAAAQNNSDAQFALGTIFYKGEGVPEDTEKAIEFFEKSAPQGNSDAQYVLGSCYLLGTGVHKDFDKAKDLLEKAAEYGLVEAQYRLGICYYTGIDIFPSDYVKATKYFYSAAMQGYAEAQLILGLFYFAGYGVAQSIEKSKIWLKKAAEQGNQEAIDFLEQLK